MRPISLVVAADDDLHRRRVRTILRHLSGRIHEARTAWDAMSLLMSSGARVDLLICDLELLPPEALALARAAGIEVPFLLLTSTVRLSVHLNAARLGATFADKPVVAGDLISSVRRICRLGVDDGPGAS